MSFIWKKVALTYFYLISESRHREDRGRGYSDQDSVVSDISIAVSSSTITKQDELQQYVEQVSLRVPLHVGTCWLSILNVGDEKAQE